MRIFSRSIIVFLFFILSFILFPQLALASTKSYLVTEGFQEGPSETPGISRVFFYKTISIDYKSGNVLLSRNPDGTGDAEIGDTVQVVNFINFSSTQFVFTYDAYGNCRDPLKLLPPTDITHLFNSAFFANHVLVRFIDWCGKSKTISQLYLVNTNIQDPSPTPTPSPTPIPGPEPFLDLPWDYEGKGLTFNEAANSISSYFDHEYPLLSSGLGEPILTKGLVTNFNGERRGDQDYSSHDGYDYGIKAKVFNGDPVLAASAGVATYVNSCLDTCGNMIVIDHENGYQTRYMHLQYDGLITKIIGERVNVLARQQIGRVGATGYVIPTGVPGAHIHFGVFEDKNKDGNFEDNVPDGVTDPFGWQSKEPDPWPSFVFDYAGQRRKGNISYYLWKEKLDNLDATLTANGGVFKTERYELNFPEGSVFENLKLSIQSSPIVKALNDLRSLGSTIVVNAFDALGNAVTEFTEPFKITIDFKFIDSSSYDLDTISIYSSTDGISWIKEITTVDLGTGTATAEVNHLTHFALMGERKDTVAPVTSVVLDGQQGQENWFRSDAIVSLDAKDNEGGLGVDYTLFKKEGGDWETYIGPLVFANEGHYKIEFYSVDKDENIESVKSVEFDIDKTLPEAKIFIDQELQDLTVNGVDQNQTAVERLDNTDTKKKDDAIYVIKDLAGNTLKLDVRDRDKDKKDSLRIHSLQYNQDTAIEQPDNRYNVNYKGKKDGLNVNEQSFEIEKEIKIRIKYDSKTNKSTIITRETGEEKTKEIKNGLILLQITTEKGTLKYSY